VVEIRAGALLLAQTDTGRINPGLDVTETCTG